MLLELYQLPSGRIVVVYDLYAIHGARRFALFADSHVAAVDDGDVVYEALSPAP